MVSINDSYPIHVALAVYDPKGTYSQHAGVTITSIFENTKSKVVIHIVHDETLSDENKKKFKRTAEKYNQTVEFDDITEYRNKIGSKLEKLSEEWTIGTLFRMFIPDALASVDKIIYLDCDIVVNLDINELWNIDLEGKSIAGSLDGAVIGKANLLDKIRRCEIKLMGHNIKSYINAGVAVMALKKIREKVKFSDMSIDWLMRHSYFHLYPDQEALNIIFKDDIKLIDAKFNIYDYTHEAKNCIIHMYTAKPWQSINGSESENCYWKMFLKNAWGENVSREELIDIFSKISASPSGLIHFHASSCFHRLTGAIKKRILAVLGFPVTLIKHVYYSLKYKIMG